MCRQQSRWRISTLLRIEMEVNQMIDFEEELKKFQPSLEIDEAEEAIYNHDLTDMTDIIQEILKQSGRDY